MKNIKTIFQKYSRWTDKEELHHYGDIYEQWLSKLKNVQTILELGCNFFGGGSLLSFADRFPQARVVGVDLTDDHIVEIVKSRCEIDVVLCDVYRGESVEMVRERYQTSFDLIIDDCMHTPNHQSAAFEIWSPLLSQDGLYVIEDVHGLDELSRRLAVWNDQWTIRLGDARRGTDDASDSILLALQRDENK